MLILKISGVRLKIKCIKYFIISGIAKNRSLESTLKNSIEYSNNESLKIGVTVKSDPK